MLEDEMLKLKFKAGRPDALAAIYDKYADHLLTCAVALLHDHSLAEDVLHDVFVNFAKSVTRFRIRGSLKAYLSTCVLNRSRDYLRKRRNKTNTLDDSQELTSADPAPDSDILFEEESARLSKAMAQLPDEQREAVVLKIKSGFKFRQIAKLQNISINAAQARYRYGIDKLRSLMNSEMEK